MKLHDRVVRKIRGKDVEIFVPKLKQVGAVQTGIGAIREAGRETAKAFEEFEEAGTAPEEIPVQ
jgi:hypothetical protein